VGITRNTKREGEKQKKKKKKKPFIFESKVGAKSGERDHAKRVGKREKKKGGHTSKSLRSKPGENFKGGGKNKLWQAETGKKGYVFGVGRHPAKERKNR